MAIYNKPDESVFASNAKQGEVNNFPDIGRGWGISFDQTGGIPPMEWFNFLFKRTDEKFGYLFQRGLSEWSATQSYPEGALVQYKNLTYKAKRANTNKKPDEAQSSDWQRWGFTQSELGVATLASSGVTQLLTSINSNDETKSATPKSVKMAYDKGVEARAAADNAQRTADNGVIKANNAQKTANEANNNANGRVSKNGDAINGILVIDGVKSGGLIIRNKASGQNTSGFVDFYQSDTVPRSSIWFRDAGKNSTQIEFLNTPEGSDWNRDSRQGVFTITSSGNLWSKAYGWLHDFFAKQNDINNVWKELNNNVMKRGDFISNWYPNHYNGTTVHKIRHLNLMITVMYATGGKELILPEHYDGHFGVWATDRGTGNISVNSNYPVGNNRVRIGGRDDTAVAVLVVGYKNV